MLWLAHACRIRRLIRRIEWSFLLNYICFCGEFSYCIQTSERTLLVNNFNLWFLEARGLVMSKTGQKFTHWIPRNNLHWKLHCALQFLWPAKKYCFKCAGAYYNLTYPPLWNISRRPNVWVNITTLGLFAIRKFSICGNYVGIMVNVPDATWIIFHTQLPTTPSFFLDIHWRLFPGNGYSWWATVIAICHWVWNR